MATTVPLLESYCKLARNGVASILRAISIPVISEMIAIQVNSKPLILPYSVLPGLWFIGAEDRCRVSRRHLGLETAPPSSRPTTQSKLPERESRLRRRSRGDVST